MTLSRTYPAGLITRADQARCEPELVDEELEECDVELVAQLQRLMEYERQALQAPLREASEPLE